MVPQHEAISSVRTPPRRPERNAGGTRQDHPRVSPGVPRTTTTSHTARPEGKPTRGRTWQFPFPHKGGTNILIPRPSPRSTAQEPGSGEQWVVPKARRSPVPKSAATDGPGRGAPSRPVTWVALGFSAPGGLDPPRPDPQSTRWPCRERDNNKGEEGRLLPLNSGIDQTEPSLDLTRPPSTQFPPRPPSPSLLDPAPASIP